MWWDHGAWGAGDWIAMSLMMLVFWGGLVALVIWVVHTLRADVRGQQQRPPTTHDADAVLAERFARGEIDEDEFARRRQLLHSCSTPRR